MRRLLCLCVMLAISGTLLCPLAFAAERESTVRVTASRLNVREGPGPDYPVVTSAERGETLVRLDEESGWLKVRTSDGSEGWVSAQYVEAIGEEAAPEGRGSSQREEGAARIEVRDDRAGGGGSALPTVLKWGCLAGAAVFGYLAYDEHSAGNDTYDEYKAAAEEGDADKADELYSETEDHDSKAQTYLIVAGVLAGAYLLQEFVLDGGSKDQAAVVPSSPLRLAWNPERAELRASVSVRW